MKDNIEDLSVVRLNILALQPGDIRRIILCCSSSEQKFERVERRTARKLTTGLDNANCYFKAMSAVEASILESYDRLRIIFSTTNTQWNRNYPYAEVVVPRKQSFLNFGKWKGEILPANVDWTMWKKIWEDLWKTKEEALQKRPSEAHPRVRLLREL